MMWGEVGIYAGVAVCFVCACLRGLMKIDPQHGMHFTRKNYVVLCLASFIGVLVWLPLAGAFTENRLLWMVLHVYFLCCSCTDYLTCQVYDVFQYVGLAASSVLLFKGEADIWIGFSVLLFALLQYFLFMKLYGAADGMAFLVAALAEASLGCDMTGYLLHMILAYLMLSLCQITKGNIGRKGTLKTPVPFLPYIMVSFWILLRLHYAGLV